MDNNEELKGRDAVCVCERRIASILFKVVREGSQIRWHLRRKGRSETQISGSFLYTVGMAKMKARRWECVTEHLTVCQTLCKMLYVICLTLLLLLYFV